MNKIKISMMAVKLGLPLGEFLNILRDVLGIKCPYCQLYANALRKINILGDAKALRLLERIVKAKKDKDLVALAKLKEEFTNGSR
jgi:hypothetical protein